VSSGAELRALVVSALVLAFLAAAWIGGWALREARDVDPTALALLERCLENERSLDVSTPARDPLAASAPDGSLTTTILGNTATVSLWNDPAAADQTVATYNTLTPENLAGRAIVRGARVILWAEPPTDAQAAPLYACMP